MGKRNQTILADMLMLLTSVIVLLLYDVWLTDGFSFLTCAIAIPAAWGMMLLFRTWLAFSAKEQEKGEESQVEAGLHWVSEFLLLLMDLYVIKTVCDFFAFFYMKNLLLWNLVSLVLAGGRVWLAWLWYKKEK